MLINLWVKDKETNTVHQVGTDVHDSIVYLDDEVIYANMQNSASTLDIYEFVEPPDLDDYVSVTPEELYLNRELIHKDLLRVVEKQTTSDYASEWIPCSERLPKFAPDNKRRKVFVTIEDETGLRFTSTAKYNEEYGRWYAFTSYRYFDDEKFKVIAWMLKPEPYEGE